MINPVWLRSFCTLAEVAHFTRTAEHLNMTQSGVSQHIHKLEDIIGQPLLVRHGKKFTLTDAGQRLYDEGREIIKSLSDLEQRVVDDPAYEGVVKIMSPGSVGLKLYPHLLDLQKKHPKLVIDYRFAPNSQVEKSIADSGVDVGFMTVPSTLDDVGCKPVAKEALLLVTPEEVTDPSWEQLIQMGFIDHPDGAHHAGLLLGANYIEYQHRHQFTTSGFSNQINLILEPVSMGMGFTVLPTHAVKAFQKNHMIRVHELSISVYETLYLGNFRNKTIPNRVNTVIDEAKKWL